MSIENNSSRSVRLRKENYEKCLQLKKLRGEKLSEIVNFAVSHYFEQLSMIAQGKRMK